MAREPETSMVDRLADGLIAGDDGPVEAFFQANDLPSPTLAWEPAAAGMASKTFEFLIEFWDRGRAGRAWPPESQIDPVDLRPALGNLLVCEPLEDLSDFRIRLYGSRLALEMGRDLTGSYISDVDPGSYVTTFYLACYRAVATRGLPLYTRHLPSARSFASEIKRLLLPFGPPERVSRILVAVDSVPRRPLGRPAWAKKR
jgi:hypothetical protein